MRDADGAVLTAFSGLEIDLSPEVRSALHLAGHYFALRGREIVQGIKLVAECPLSPRQIDCLRWVQAGKTDAEIAILLRVLPRTVHNHVENAKAVLSTPSARWPPSRRGGGAGWNERLETAAHLAEAAGADCRLRRQQRRDPLPRRRLKSRETRRY